MIRIAHIYREAKLKKLRDLKAVFLTLKIRQRWRRRRKRWALFTETEGEKKTRFILTFMSNAVWMEPQKKSKEVFRHFMEEQIEQEKMKMCFRDFYGKIVFMQNKMKDMMIIRHCKVEVLNSAWDQVYTCIMRKASKRKD